MTDDMDQVFSNLENEIEEVPAPGTQLPQANQPVQDPTQDDQDDNQPKDEYHGVSREQVIDQLKSTKSEIAKLREDFSKQFEALKIPPTDKQVVEAVDYLKEIGLTQDQIDQMSGTDIVKMMFEKMEDRTSRKISDALKQRDEVSKSAQKQIDDAYGKYPALKPKGTYKDTVKMVLENAKLKKQYLTLDQACQQANRILNTDGQSDGSGSAGTQTQIKRSRIAVETGEGSPISPNQMDTEEMRIHKLLNGGETGILGGL